MTRGADGPICAKRRRLAIVISHPIQYYAPWFAYLAGSGELEVRVFYLWDFGVSENLDTEFGETFRWDVPLLNGYEYEFIENASSDPGTHHYSGLDNPAIVARLKGWTPDAILLFGYSYKTHIRVCFSPSLIRIPILFRGDSHNMSRPSSLKSFLARALRRIVFRRFAGFLAVGEANRSYLIDSGADPSTIVFAPHCVDNDGFRRDASAAQAAAAVWKRELGIPSDATVILFAGKLIPEKRPLDLLRAFLRMRGNASRTVLLFVGSGPLEQELREAAGENVGRDVFFAHFQNQSAMPKVYSAAHLLVLPSASESWGLCVNEAMNFGVPAVVSSVVGCAADLIEPGGTGWTFKTGDVSALASALSDALCDPSRLKATGRRARDRVEGYSYERAKLGLLQALEMILPS